jgi:hypothetical protein
MKSPGAPSHRREVEREFWKQVATGITSEAAAFEVYQAVGTRCSRHCGGMPPTGLKPGAGHYSSFAERKEIPLLRAKNSAGSGRSHARSGGRRRRCRAGCSATQRYVAERSSIERRSLDGDPTSLRSGRSLASWSRTRGCATSSRTDGPGSCVMAAVKLRSRPAPRSLVATGHIAATGDGCAVGALSRSRSGSGSISPMMRPCGSVTKRSTIALQRKPGALKRELVLCLRTGRALRVPSPRAVQRGLTPRPT